MQIKDRIKNNIQPSTLGLFDVIADKIENSSDVKALDPDGNLRYVGYSPANYVKFNNELWRIVGIFDGQAKIMRKESYGGNALAWNTNASNDWATSTLKNELNGNFYNSIDATSKTYIDVNHVWRIGSPYEGNRREYVYDSENSASARTWTGAIGLINASDYGYSTQSCESVALRDFNASECRTSSWIYITYMIYPDEPSTWLLTIKTSSSYGPTAGCLTGNGSISIGGFGYGSVTANRKMSAHPTLYLKSTVKITGGTGTGSDPYILGM